MSSTTSQSPENLRCSSIILTPVAEGPSTPEPVATVSNAGGVGILIAGYLTVEKLAEQARQTCAPLNDGKSLDISLFCSSMANARGGTSKGEPTQWTALRNRLAPVAVHFGADLSDTPTWSDDCLPAKVETTLADNFLPSPNTLEFVSFTFDYPDKEVIARVEESGCRMILNVTPIKSVRAAAAADVGRTVLQGLTAGGRRTFVKGEDSPDSIGASMEKLAQAVAEANVVTDVPITAANGVNSREDAVKLVGAGAATVQVDMRFLTTTETGTREVHRRTLHELAECGIALTCAFPGKSARATKNTSARELSMVAPELYP